MLRALILVAVLGLSTCGHDEKPPPAPSPPHDPYAPVAAPITPVQQEPLKPQ
jgi:hypothetical protein